jgi:hypothetical protein
MRLGLVGRRLRRLNLCRFRLSRLRACGVRPRRLRRRFRLAGVALRVDTLLRFLRRLYSRFGRRLLRRGVRVIGFE